MTKKKGSKRNRQEKSRAMALRTSEPKLQEQVSTPNRRQPRGSSVRKVQRRSDNSLPTWPAWEFALRQQNLWFSSFSNMLALQQQVARMWLGLETSRTERK